MTGSPSPTTSRFDEIAYRGEILNRFRQAKQAFDAERPPLAGPRAADLAFPAPRRWRRKMRRMAFRKPRGQDGEQGKLEVGEARLRYLAQSETELIPYCVAAD
jgi:hypothetical protein